MHTATAADIDYLVRVATPDDEGPLIDLLSRTLAEPDGSGFRDFHGQPYPVSAEVLAATVRYMLAPENTAEACCGVIDTDGEITGSVGLMVLQPYYSERRYLGDVWRCVVPRYREHVLVDFAMRVGRRMRLDLVLGNCAENRIAARDRLLERMIGIKKYGGSFFVPYNPIGNGEAG